MVRKQREEARLKKEAERREREEKQQAEQRRRIAIERRKVLERVLRDHGLFGERVVQRYRGGVGAWDERSYRANLHDGITCFTTMSYLVEDFFYDSGVGKGLRRVVP